MGGNEVDRTVDALVSALVERDRDGIRSLLSDETRLSYDGGHYGIDALEDWLAQFWPSGTVQIQAAKVAARGQQYVLTAIGCGGDAGGATLRLLRSEWTFTVRAARVVAVDIGAVARTTVPRAIVSYIKATNTFDLDMLLATFADDALVNDQLRDYWGKAAIGAWAANEIVGERITMAVVNIVEHYNSIIITANVDGDYDKRGLPDPLVLAFYFSAQGDKIVQLIILRNIVDAWL